MGACDLQGVSGVQAEAPDSRMQVTNFESMITIRFVLSPVLLRHRVISLNGSSPKSPKAREGRSGPSFDSKLRVGFGLLGFWAWEAGVSCGDLYPAHP